MSANDEITQSICREFREAHKYARPSIEDYVNRVPESQRQDLLSQLVPIDIVVRKQLGDEPELDDYAALGAAAVDCATKILPRENGVASVEKVGWQLRSNVPVSGQITAMLPDDSTPGDISPGTIGPYRLLRKIGKGGMGTVWLAEQSTPVRRRVAVKLIRADIDHAGAMSRFAAERQAIAMMDHQNIAKILDAGTTATGIPFFVMEYVDGMRLDRYCDENNLSIREQLELMVPVCRAVQHAHHKGIIHRDLKPSNIVVAKSDGKAIPKVIDFGLAKALEPEQRLTEETALTRLGEVVGTLQYLSPEQAMGQEIDTRSDIYALGVTIYKLLTGTTPVQRDTVSNHSLVEVLELIREKDPPRPSQRVVSDSYAEERTAEQRKHRLEPTQQILEGDVDWIVMKALEKDPDRRYETANSLALDIERFLNDKEVLARPPTSIYRIQKFVKRNRGLVASMLTIAVLLLAGAIGTGVGLIVALSERDRANQNAEESRRNEEQSRKHEREARESESRRMQMQHAAENQLYATQIKSAWSDWQLGNVESAWKMLQSADAKNHGWESRFLKAQFTASRNTLYGHSIRVTDVEVSPDGKYFATSGSAHRIRIWNAASQQLVYVKQVTGAVNRICFSPDSTMIAATDSDNRITLWNSDTGDTRKVFGPFPHDIFGVSFLGDRKVLIAGECHNDRYREGSAWRFRNEGKADVLLLSIDDGRVLNRLTGHEKTITQLDSTDDGQTIVSSSEDGTLRVFREHQSQTWTSTVLQGHGAEVTGLSVSPSGDELASSSRDKTVLLWSLESGEIIRTFVGHQDDVTDVAFCSDGRRLVTASLDQTARVWDRDGAEIAVRRGHFGPVHGAAFLPGNTEIVSVSDDQTVRIWGVNSSSGFWEVKPHDDIVWQADLSADGEVAVSCCEDGTVARIATATGKIKSVVNTGRAVLSIAYSPVSDVFATGDENAELKVWNGASGTVIKTITAHDGYIWDLDFSPDGKRLVTSSSDKTAKIWSTDSWKSIGTLKGHLGELGSGKFSSDGCYIVTSSDDETVRLWDAANQKCVHMFTGHSHSVWRAEFSPDSKLIASSGYNGELLIWSVPERTLLRRIDGHSNQVAGLAFTADGSRVVTASDDGTSRIFDLNTGLELFVLRDKGDSMMLHASFSRSGRSLVTTNGTGWVTMRSATDTMASESIFLPENALEFCTAGLPVVIAEEATAEDLERQLKLATQCCNTFDSYRSWTIRGICELRLGLFDAAVDSLREAQQLEPRQYGEPDERPDIEAVLAWPTTRPGRKNSPNRLEQSSTGKAGSKHGMATRFSRGLLRK